MDPRKTINKVLTENGVRKAKAYANLRRKEYEDALLLKYSDLPELARGSAGRADGWRSANSVNQIGPMVPFSAVYRGCKRSSSTLRPHHSVTGSGLGTDADAGVPAALADLQKDNFFADGFVSGHVMNADFGGVGSNPGNQTILTDMANSVHKGGWEAPVKKAQYFMTLAVKNLRAFELDTAKESIVDTIESTWRIELSGVVADQSWWDVLDTADQGTLTPDQEEIAKSITTELNFTATAQGTPTDSQLEQLELDMDGTEFRLVVQYLQAFRELMAQVGTFKLTQTPNGFEKATVTSS